MYAHILLAADGSENAERAAQEAVKVASETSLVEVLYVISVDEAKEEMLHTQTPESLFLTRRRKLATIERLLREHHITHKVTILKGEPGPTIVRYAEEQQVDLVVVGSRGLNGLQQMMLGSVSHKVIKRVNCPTLIVK